ncbi:MAG: hypothetical protein ACJAT4_001162, partial [Granulosicoccus sp.]
MKNVFNGFAQKLKMGQIVLRFLHKKNKY